MPDAETRSNRKPLLIFSASHFSHPVDQQLPEIKSILQTLCGKKIRRIDRFTQLALIGSFQCRAERTLPHNTGVYLSSGYSSLNNAAKVLGEIYQQGQLPKPLNFINTVSNTACFYLSEQLGLAACNQFVTSESFTLEAGLAIASLDLELGRTGAALVGQVCEVDAHPDFHRQRLQLEAKQPLIEGSHWLLLAHEMADQPALAKITALQAPITERELIAVLSGLKLASSEVSSVFDFGDTIDATQRAKLMLGFDASERCYAPAAVGQEFPSAMHVHGFLATKESPRQLVYVDQNPHGDYSVIAIEKLD